MDNNDGRIVRATWIAAWAALVLGQLHALSRHATEDGKADLDLALTRAWAEPAADLFRPLLDWASPDAVYLTYGKFWFPVVLLMTLCAFAVHRRRTPYGFEKWAWRVALTGYVGGCLGTFLDYWTQWTDYNSFFDIAFAVTVPAVAATLIGSSLLGIALLRRRADGKLGAWLLALTFPLGLFIPEVTSLGNVLLPVVFGIALLGRATLATVESVSPPRVASARR